MLNTPINVIALDSLADIRVITDACVKRFPAWKFTITKDADLKLEKLTAVFEGEIEWVKGKRRLTRVTNRDWLTANLLIPAYAEAFHTGLLKGREEMVKLEENFQEGQSILSR